MLENRVNALDKMELGEKSLTLIKDESIVGNMCDNDKQMDSVCLSEVEV